MARISIPNATSLLLLLMLGANYFVPFADLDYTWQIRTGGEIVRTGDLRPVEAFSYTINGTRPPDFEWLYEVILWGVWSVFGYGGLKLLKTLLVATPLVVVAWHLRTQDMRWHGVALAVGFGVFVLTSAWNMRPLFCSTICLLLVTSWLHNHCTGRRPLPWALPLVMLLWGNLHPGVIMGQGLLAGAVGWEWLNCWLKWNPPLTSDALRRLTLLGGLGLAATFLSPDPLERLWYPFLPELRHPIMRTFAEMRPLYAIARDAPFIVAAALALAVLVALTVVLRFRHYRLWEVALLLCLAGLANAASRSLQDWVLVMLLLGVPHFVHGFRWAAAHRHRPINALLLRFDSLCKRACYSPLLRFQPTWPLTGLALLVVVSLTPPLCWNMPVQEDADVPTAALDFMEQHNYRGRVFASPNLGAYVTWRLKERAQCYTDTRGFYFPPTLLEDSLFVPELLEDWRQRLNRVLDEYHTDYFLLESEGPRGALWRLLQVHIDRPLYLDRQVVLLSADQVRRGVKMTR